MNFDSEMALILFVRFCLVGISVHFTRNEGTDGVNRGSLDTKLQHNKSLIIAFEISASKITSQEVESCCVDHISIHKCI